LIGGAAQLLAQLIAAARQLAQAQHLRMVSRQRTEAGRIGA